MQSNRMSTKYFFYRIIESVENLVEHKMLSFTVFANFDLRFIWAIKIY
jgi:hypothetical protein